MGRINLNLPEPLYRTARELAERENISVNQLITMALAEKISALMTEDYLEARAKRGYGKSAEGRTGRLRQILVVLINLVHTSSIRFTIKICPKSCTSILIVATVTLDSYYAWLRFG